MRLSSNVAAILKGTRAFPNLRISQRWCSIAPSDAANEDASANDEWAYNHVEKKKGLLKPHHTIDEQIAYMGSKVFENSYKGLPVFKWYRRNMKGQAIMQPPPRMFCIDKDGRFRLNHACPICRDEYLFFDYRNPKLIEQFLASGTDQPIDILQSGLCRDQYGRLKAQLLKAKEHGMFLSPTTNAFTGTIEFGVEFRVFDYRQWYPNWQEPDVDSHELVDIPLARRSSSLEHVFEDKPVLFPAHKPDTGNNWDEWWKRHDKFAKKAR